VGIVVLLTAAGLILTQVVRGRGLAASSPIASSPALVSSTSPVELTAQSVSHQIIDRGIVSGTIQLRTAVPADARTWVAYVLRGPGTLVRVAPTAPYEINLDTYSVPDGAYVLNEVAFHTSQAPWVRTSRMQISNIPAAAGVPNRPISPGTMTSPSLSPALAVSPAASSGPALPSAPSSPAQSAPAVKAMVAAGPAHTAAPVAPVLPVAAAAPVLSDLLSQVVALTNAERAKAGCGPLTVDSRLTAAAQAHSDDMATRNYFSHTSQDGRTPFQRMAAAGYQFSIAAENIAAGQRTPADVMTGWMNSAGHRANILNCSLKQIGVGYGIGGSYGMYWTQDFGTP
jgi:uncharacterized protein YkwD